jgi:hypothetical protein
VKAPPKAPRIELPDDFTLAFPPAMRLAFGTELCVVTRAGALACGDGCAPATVRKDFAATAAIHAKLGDASAFAVDPASGRGCAITGALHDLACWEAGAAAPVPVPF